MNKKQKIAAFDDLAIALTNRWQSGEWSWWCCNPSGGTETMRQTQAEAIADLVAWAKRTRERKERKTGLVNISLDKQP